MYIDWSNNSFQIETEMKSWTKEMILCIINNVYYKSCRKNYDFLHFCSVYVPMFRFVFSKLTLFDPLPWAVVKCALRVSLPDYVKNRPKIPSFSLKTNKILFLLQIDWLWFFLVQVESLKSKIKQNFKFASWSKHIKNNKEWRSNFSLN